MQPSMLPLTYLVICIFFLVLAMYLLVRRRPIWLKILIGLGVPVALIVGAILALQVKFFADLHGGRCKDESGFRRVFCGMLETYDYYAYRAGLSQTYEEFARQFRSLPSDSEMIANFREHRADFEHLVQVYRKDLSVPTVLNRLMPTPEIKEIMHRIHVKTVVGDDIVWSPPDPYSLDPGFQKQHTELLLRPYRERGKFSGVVLYYDHPTAMGNKYPLYKKYYYVPCVPKVRTGKLLLPGDPYAGCLAENLDTMPLNACTAYGRCAYRQIQPQWFIGLCEGE